MITPVGHSWREGEAVAFRQAFYKLLHRVLESAGIGINIKHEAYERAIRKLASDQGVSLTDAIGLAVLNELERRERQERSADFMTRLLEVQRHFAMAPILDPRPYREILYDEDGLPK